MKKSMRFSALILSFALLALPAAAQSAGFENFRKISVCPEGTFSDVGSGDWFYESVTAAYETGLMIGKGEGRFDPAGNVKISETLTLAARLHALYHTGSADFVQQGQTWYQTYAEYDEANGIVDLKERTAAGLPVYDPDAPASRREFARILAAALPDEAWEAIRSLPDGSIPDVPMSDPDCSPVYKLYRAGVLIGNDERGTFAPDKTIRRSEVAAVVTRMAIPALRIAQDSGQNLDSLVLTADGHPELDFGRWDHDGAPMIRDYAVTPQDTVLILQMTGTVSEYDFSGKLLGVYDYSLAEQGLTAFRICAGQKEIYLLDGRNNAVLTCTRAGVTKVSPVRWNDLGLSDGYFCCDSEGRLWLSAANPTETTPGNIGVSYTYELDLTGSEAAVAQTVYGLSFSEHETFQTDKRHDTLCSDEIYADLYRAGSPYCTVTVTSLREDEKTLMGMPVIGIIDGEYLFRVIELLTSQSGASVQETFFLVNPETGASRACQSSVTDASLIRYRNGEAYFLTRTENSIRIQPLSKALEPSDREAEAFRVTVRPAE